jgi:hypothetical protein
MVNLQVVETHAMHHSDTCGLECTIRDAIGALSGLILASTPWPYVSNYFA